MTYDFKKGGLAQLARASALHAEGHRFDSDILHFFKQGVLMIIQVLPAGGIGWFNSINITISELSTRLNYGRSSLTYWESNF